VRLVVKRLCHGHGQERLVAAIVRLVMASISLAGDFVRLVIASASFLLA
jgi:hypothetical protein